MHGYMPVVAGKCWPSGIPRQKALRCKRLRASTVRRPPSATFAEHTFCLRRAIMWDANLRRRLCWMGGGLILGLVFGGIWPDSPAHAVATSQIDGFAACTTPLDNEIEGIFILDSITGDLKGTALNPVTRQFTVSFGTNV